MSNNIRFIDQTLRDSQQSEWVLSGSNTTCVVISILCF